MATRVDYVNSIKNADMDTIYLTGAGYVNYPFKGISRESALGWNERVWGSELNRGLNLVMDNIDTVEYGMVARCEVSFKYMNIEDYKVLCKISKQRVCYANFFDRETGQRVSQEMAFTGNEIAKLYKFNTDYLGVLDVSIKLVATNRDRISEISATHTVTYNENSGSGSISQDSNKWGGQVILASSGFTRTGYTLLGWNTQQDGNGKDYELGQSITIFGNLTLYAKWGKNITLKTGEDFAKVVKTFSNPQDISDPYAMDMVTEEIIIDNYTGENSYIVDGINKIDGLSSVGHADLNNEIDVYKTQDNKTVFVLAPKNTVIYANTDCSNMFSNMVMVSSIQFNNFKTSNTTNMSGMLAGVGTVSTITIDKLDLSCFDTSNVTDMSQMFFSTKANEINLTSFDTSNVTNMNSMFRNIITRELDLRSFATSNVNDMAYMFSLASTTTRILTKIYVDSSKWNTSSVTQSTSMFNYCVELIGGNGTTYNSSIIDKTYARVDLPNQPGYLTEAY